MTWQTHYASHLDPGFDPGPLLTLASSADMRNPQVHAFRDALARLPGVSGVAVASAPVTDDNRAAPRCSATAVPRPSSARAASARNSSACTA